jgi:hypothetical protein
MADSTGGAQRCMAGRVRDSSLCQGAQSSEGTSTTSRPAPPPPPPHTHPTATASAPVLLASPSAPISAAMARDALAAVALAKAVEPSAPTAPGPASGAEAAPRRLRGWAALRRR